MTGLSANPALLPARLFHGVERDRPVLLAVSGGSDSLALLLLAAAWAHESNANLQVVTVDHGLRPEAAAEAAFVAGVSDRVGLPHITLAWDGIKPDTGLSQAARHARYHLLEEYAIDTGAAAILTGHTANDQAETVAMRLRRDSGASNDRGLSGMARTTILPGGTRLVRPLLGETRDRLRTYLLDHHQGWIDDPSNHDLSYERVGIRQALEGDRERMQRLLRFSAVVARHRQALSVHAAGFLGNAVKCHPGPVFELSDAIFDATLPKQVRLHALQILIAIAGGRDHLVSEVMIATNVHEGSSGRTTLGGAVIEPRRGGLRIYRERRNLPAMLVRPGEDLYWDGRLKISNDSATSWYCGPADREGIAAFEEARGRRISTPSRAALFCTPMLRGDGDEQFFPFLAGFDLPKGLKIEPVSRAIQHFCPQHDFPVAEWFGDVVASGGFSIKAN